jgi:predicted O-methyltransferase YrrM
LSCRRFVEIYSTRIADYLKHFESERSQVLIDIEKACEARELEPVSPDVGAFLRFLVDISKCRRVLEIGTCLGYSTICMAQGLRSEGLIETIEVDQGRASEAEENFKKADVASKIRILHGFALNILPTLNRDYDLVFIDALKTEYPQYLDYSLRLVRKGGVIVGDDALLGELGWGDDASKKALNEFNRRICNELRGVLIPLGDGLTLTTV